MASPQPASRSRTASTGVAASYPATRPSAVSCGLSRDPVARSAVCRSANRHWRMPSSSWLAAAWLKRSRHDPPIGGPDLPEDDRGPLLSAHRRLLSQQDLGHHRDALAADWHDRHDLRLPRPARARPLSRFRRSRRGAARILAKRDLGDGHPILLGSRRRKPRAFCHGPDQPGGDLAWYGLRRRLRQPDAIGRRSGSSVDSLRRQLFGGGPATGPWHFLPDHLRPLLPRHAAGESFPLLPARGLAAGRRAARADLLPQRFLLPRPELGRGRGRRGFADPADARPGCHPPARSPRNSAVHSHPVGAARDRGPDRRVCGAIAGQPSLSGAAGSAGRAAHPALDMSETIAQWRGFKAATRLGWEISSNWTQPLIFVIYSVVRPLSAAFILVVMYRVISGGAPGTATYLAFLVSGVAFWSFVQYGFAGLANGMADDRGEYRMLKYVYTSPVHFYVYLLGRGLAQLAAAVASAAVVLGGAR